MGCRRQKLASSRMCQAWGTGRCVEADVVTAELHTMEKLSFEWFSENLDAS
jgi:hypothetical protein